MNEFQNFEDLLIPGTNTGVIVDPKDTDWKAGQETGSTFREILPEGDWRRWMPSSERQTARIRNRTYLETNACMTFAALNSLEAVMNLEMANGVMPERHRAFLSENGYLDRDGRMNASDRFTAKMSRTDVLNGNSFNNVYGSIRKDGLVPEPDWAFPVEQIGKAPERSRWGIYYEEIPENLRERGRNWLKFFDVHYDLVRYPGSGGTLSQWLRYSPLHILTPVCQPWNTREVIRACSLPVQHGTSLIHIDDVIYVEDHYIPFVKRFALDYPIPWAVRVSITYKDPNAEPPAFTYEYKTNLRLGDPDSPEVRAMQRGLQTVRDRFGRAYLTAGTFGPFGPVTRAALGRFQRDNGISDPDGPGTNFGPRSRRALTNALLGISTRAITGLTEQVIMEGGPTATITMKESPKFTINGTDIWKAIRGGLVTLAAAALTGLIGFVGANYESWQYQVCLDSLPCFDAAFLAIPAIGTLLELGRRWLSGQPK